MPLIIKESSPTAITRAADGIKEGKVLLYPTDTIYGLGCDALNSTAIERIKSIKGREAQKPFILLAGSLDSLVNYFIIKSMENELSRIWPGPFTVLLRPLPGFPAHLSGPNGKVAVRIPRDSFLSSLFNHWPGLLVSTSANISNAPYHHEWNLLKSIFENAVDILIHRIPYPVSAPSAVVDYTKGKWETLRHGPLPWPVTGDTN